MLKKAFHYKKIWAVVALLVLLALGIAQAAGGKEQRSSVAGQVVSTVSVGEKVNEGAVLVTVKTLVGSAPAARANCDGTVVSVSVQPGQQVAANQVVAEIAP